jgi:cell division protein ZapE
MPSGVVEAYRERVARDELEADPAQIEAATRLGALAEALAATGRAESGFLSRLRRPPPLPRGLYIHGGVGRGKTMLMDLLFENVDDVLKTRAHFHAFMAGVHERLAEARRKASGDPILAVGEAIARQARLLCLDELHVVDIADAMILGRLFKVLLDRGVVVVATSNAHPTELYPNGLNRQLFLPFIDLIEERLDILRLVAAKDFRLDKLAGRPLYFTPADARARAELEHHWQRLTGHHPGAPHSLEVKGRTLLVPKASMGVAWLGFSELCERPLGSLDYLGLAHAFHTLLLEAIPVLGPARRDVARRFINLIDTLYDNRVCLIASAEAEPDALYPRGDGADHFQRTVSRLMEMRSEGYLVGRQDRIRKAPVGV